MRYLLTILFLICSRHAFCAQQVFSKPMHFFGQLSSNEIVDIYQDREGYIWLGTTKGLERYDGYELQLFKADYRNPALLADNAVTCLADDERHVWIGTRQGLNLFEKTSCRIYPFPGTTFQGKTIRYMVSDKKGHMWIATGKKLFKCNREQSVVKEYDFSSYFSSDLSEVCSIYPDRSGNLWVLTWGGGLFRYVPENDSFVMFPKIGIQNNPYSMYQDSSGCYWIATWGDGLWSFFPEKTPDQCYVKHEILNPRGGFPEPIFYSITQDEVYGNLWVLSYNELYVLKLLPSGGLERVDIRDVVDPYKMYTKILKDREGSLWLSSYDMAYNVFFSNAKIEKYPLPQLKEHAGWDPNLLKMCLDRDGVMWINQDRYGLCVYDMKKDRMGYNDVGGYPRSIEVNALARSGFKEGVWAGYRYDPHVMRLKCEGLKISLEETFRLEDVVPDPGAIRQIVEDRKGNLWTLTSSHLFVKPVAGNSIVYDEKKLSVRALAMDGEGNVWASSDQHIYHLSCFPGGISIVSEESLPLLISNERVEHLCVDGKGRIWLTTSLGRICRSDPWKRKFERVSMEYQAKNNSVLNLLSDNRYVWIVTNNRILRYDILRGEVKGYANSDGNISVSIFRNEAAYPDGKGGLYAGGHGGFVYIHPEEEPVRNETKQYLAITDVKAGSHSLFFSGDSGRHKAKNTLQKIMLDPEDRDVEILFSALSYFPNRETRFAYKLEGVDRDWVYPDKDKHAAYYNRIPKGTYRFWLKSTDEQGHWGEGVMLLTIGKLPAFYEAWYAYVFYTLCAGLLVFGLSRMYLRRVQRRHEAKLQEELVRAKLDYFTNISHELLTPLTVISCATDYLEVNTSSAGKMTGALRSNVDRLKRLLQQILDFRRVEYGRMVLKVTQGDIRSFIRDICAANLMPLARKKGVVLQVEIPPEELWGYLDFDKADKVLYNLLSNAVKYTPEGKPVRLAIRVEHREAHRFLIVVVEDEGIGIALKEQDRIFEQFYTNGQNGSTESNGIGLSLTKALVLLHHGTIRVESELGKGACFTVELPIDRDCYSEAEQAANVPEAADEQTGLQVTDAEGNKPSVLLVEDNVELLDLMKDIFIRRYNVLTGSDGLQAWTVLENRQVDVVVSDVMMPGMDGWELCRKIKSDLRFSHIPVVVLTAKSGMDDRVASYEAGADGYIAKPFEMEVLFARIDNLIKSYQIRQTVFRKDAHVDLAGLQYKPSDSRFLQSVIDSIEKHLNESEFDLEQLAVEMNMSKSTLYRKVKGMTGLTPLDFVRNVKLKRACTMLEEGGLTISEVAYTVGFSNPKYFTKCFKEEFGMTPSEYQQKCSS